MLSLDHRSGNIFQTLLDFKADLSLTNDEGNNIYHLVLNWQMADRLGPLLNVEHFDPIFLQHKNHQHYSPLAEMVKLNDPQVLLRLMSLGVRFGGWEGPRRDSLLHIAVRHQCYKSALFLREQSKIGLDVKNADG